MRDLEVEVTVLIPAWSAQAFLARAVRSALNQAVESLEVLVVADDEVNYLDVLRADDVVDPRVRMVRTGGTATGCAHARNVGLNAARGRFIAMLDADDVMHPDKLAIMLPHAADHGAAACVLKCCEFSDGGRTRVSLLGAGTPTGPLGPQDYLRTHPTANAMLVFDRTRVRHHWREDLPALEDIVFSIEAFDAIESIYHVDQPLHLYVRRHGSMSTGPAATARMIAAKEALLQMLGCGNLRITDAALRQELAAFLDVSLAAERAYAAALARGERASFFDLLMPRLRPGSGACGQRAIT